MSWQDTKLIQLSHNTSTLIRVVGGFGFAGGRESNVSARLFAF